MLEAAQDNYDLAAELFKEGLEQRSDNTYIMQVHSFLAIGNTESITFDGTNIVSCWRIAPADRSCRGSSPFVTPSFSPYEKI